MRELVAIREVLNEIHVNVLSNNVADPEYSTKYNFCSIPQSTVFEDNQACLKYKKCPQEPNTLLFRIISSDLKWLTLK